MDKSALLGPGGDEGHSMLSASMPISAPAAVVVTAVPTAPASAAGPLTGQLSTLGQLIAAKNAAAASGDYGLAAHQHAAAEQRAQELTAQKAAALARQDYIACAQIDAELKDGDAPAPAAISLAVPVAAAVYGGAPVPMPQQMHTGMHTAAAAAPIGTYTVGGSKHQRKCNGVYFRSATMQLHGRPCFVMGVGAATRVIQWLPDGSKWVIGTGPGTGFVARTAAESPLNAAHDTMGGPAPTDKWHSYAKTKTGGLAFCNDRTMFTSPGMVGASMEQITMQASFATTQAAAATAAAPQTSTGGGENYFGPLSCIICLLLGGVPGLLVCCCPCDTR